jgi:hypothetical protein
MDKNTKAMLAGWVLLGIAYVQKALLIPAISSHRLQDFCSGIQAGTAWAAIALFTYSIVLSVFDVVDTVRAYHVTQRSDA